MLTGDKVETATCIAISAGLKNKRQQIYYIRDMENKFEFRERLDDFEKKPQQYLLIIDGGSLSIAL